MAIYDLYGSITDDIDMIRRSLETLLAIEFETHESLYQGEYFQYGKTEGEHLILKKNLDPYDGDVAELSFPEHKVLLYVNDIHQSVEQYEISRKSQDLALLRHEDL